MVVERLLINLKKFLNRILFIQPFSSMFLIRTAEAFRKLVDVLHTLEILITWVVKTPYAVAECMLLFNEQYLIIGNPKASLLSYKAVTKCELIIYCNILYCNVNVILVIAWYAFVRV